MIGRIAGILLEKHPPLVLVDVGGVGYEIDVPMSTFYNLPALGEKIALHTQLIVREDAHQLYGFSTHDERAAFRQLLKISGVGPKLALTILSGMSVAELSHVVAAQEVGRLTKIPGIGKKTAERLLLELRDKLPGAAAVLLTSGTEPGPAIRNDVLDALLALGYNEREANWAVKQLPANLDVSDSIRQALKFLSKA
ncbi:holliday junction DNA helicase RuvA [Sulfuricella denitrificans skB26]|uniref:Holliday junction branch migration complex subunit RuvA n=1 Tax=Sulfuricella denitrificans (strain DSM 22764 / NBRC 105220 / skB26) TaxID=1163617 RepID=S6B1D7_SULDS|nr:Holliday junction branch migration protein RuvA [Sulfuricella denitrificans]BAN34512.1 holliday junction DNA helicase RuvA [Sulfuricella denitrificans skB26]